MFQNLYQNSLKRVAGFKAKTSSHLTGEIAVQWLFLQGHKSWLDKFLLLTHDRFQAAYKFGNETWGYLDPDIQGCFPRKCILHLLPGLP